MSYQEPEYSPSTERGYNSLPGVLRDADAQQLYPVEVPETTEAFNYAKNPSFETYGPGVDIGKNYYPNPSFEAPGGELRTVARNLITNPNGRQTSGFVNVRTNLTYGAAIVAENANASLTPGVQFGGSAWTRLAQSVAGAGILHANAELAQLVNGRTYTSSLELANDGTSTSSVSLQWCDGKTIVVNVPAKSRGRVSITDSKDVYSEDDRRLVVSMIDGSNILFRQVLIEAAGKALPFFDGTTWGQDADLSPAWSGDQNASISHLRAPAPVGWLADAGVVYFSSRNQCPVLFSPYGGKTTARVNHNGGQLTSPVTAIGKVGSGGEWYPGFTGAWPPPRMRVPEDGEVVEVQLPVLKGTEQPPVGYVGAYWISPDNTVYRRSV